MSNAAAYAYVHRRRRRRPGPRALLVGACLLGAVLGWLAGGWRV